MLRYNPIDPSIIEDTAKQNQAKGMCAFFYYMEFDVLLYAFKRIKE